MYEFHAFTKIPAELSLKVLNPYEIDSFLKVYKLVTLKIQQENRQINWEEQKHCEQ
jgi:hypothetical protein